MSDQPSSTSSLIATALREVVTRTSEHLIRRQEVGSGPPTFGDEWSVGDVWAWIPSGIPVVDLLLGGGLPLGRMSEVYSQSEADGKTTLLLHFVVQVQAAGGVAVWLESETSLDKHRAASLGVKLNELVLWGPPTLEAGFDFIERILRNIDVNEDLRAKPILIVWDTISSACTTASKEGDDLGSGMSKPARVLAQALRRLTVEFWRYRVHVAFLSQTMIDIKASSSMFSGPALATPTGRAIKFYSSVRIELKRAGWVDATAADLGGAKGEAAYEAQGMVTRIRVVKNKLAVPWRRGKMELFPPGGFDPWASVVATLLDRGHPAVVDRGQGQFCTGSVEEGSTEVTEVNVRGLAALRTRARTDPGVQRYLYTHLAAVWALPPDRIRDADGWVRPRPELRQTDLSARHYELTHKIDRERFVRAAKGKDKAKGRVGKAGKAKKAKGRRGRAAPEDTDDPLPVVEETQEGDDVAKRPAAKKAASKRASKKASVKKAAAKKVRTGTKRPGRPRFAETSTKADWMEFTVRACVSKPKPCALCNSIIKPGSNYYDGGANRRAHETCVNKMRDA